jgi:acetate kinase
VHHPDKVNQGRIISLQLGSGCSITATAGGVPLDTSMGFSPLEGLVMSTRAGDLDPGVLLYLIRECGMSVEELNVILNQESGLYGLSGNSDMRVLLASTDPAARIAIDIYCYRARKYIGAYLAALGGADAILFGGGVGEHAAEIRSQILIGLEWAGINLNPLTNMDRKKGEYCISSSESKVEVWVIPVDESIILAESAVIMLENKKTTTQI